MRQRWRVHLSNGAWYVQSRYDWDNDWITHCACPSFESAMREIALNNGDLAIEVDVL
jgi:hypothetical protein